MKKLLLGISFSLLTVFANSQTYEYKTYDNVTGSDFTIVKDLAPATISSNASQVGLVDMVNTGTPSNTNFCLIAYNNNIGTPVTGRHFTLKSGTNNIYSHRIIQIGSDFYILFSYIDASSVERFAVMKYNLGSGAVVWNRYFNGTLAGSQNTVDMEYDGSGYLYLVGDVPTSNEDIWVAKINLGGTLSWYYTYADNVHSDETAWNIHYRSDSSIYIGATTAVSSTDQAGLILEINSNGGVVNSKKIRFFPFPATPQQLAERLYVKSSGSNVYTVAIADKLGSPKTLFIAKMNTSLQILACTFRDATFFRLLPEFRFVNGDIVVSGSTDPLSSQTQSYITEFYSMTTTAFISAARYFATISNSGEITLDNDPSNFNLFNTANVGNTTGVIYRIKGNAGNGATQCDSAFVPDSLRIDTTILDFNLVRDSSAWRLDTLVFKVPGFTPTDTFICDTGTSAHRLMMLPRNVASVYPNPTTGQLNITTENEGPVWIEISGMDGRMLMKKEFAEGKTISIDVSDLSNGVYLLSIINSEGVTEIHKIIRE